MKKTILTFTALILIAAPALADYSGGQIYWARIGGYYAGNGGEFTMQSDGGPGLLLSNSVYDAKARGQDDNASSFQTFCVETGEYVAQPMAITVSTTWHQNAANPQWDLTATVTQPASHAVWGGGQPGVGDDLNPQTAYLYHHFATGVLSNYFTASSRSASAGSLQNAIWFIEGESSTLDAQAIAWVQEAVDATGLAVGSYTPTTGSNPTWGQTIGDVRVLNMYGYNKSTDTWTDLKQDQLYLVPVPAAVVLGAIGLALVGLKMRRLA
jgi:hypothetical protein